MKLMPIIFLLILSFVFGWSQNICTLKEDSSIEACKQNMLYFIDKDSLYNEPSKVPNELFQSNNNKTLLGHIASPIWTKLSLTYAGEKEKSIIFLNPKVTINTIEVFIYDKNQTLIKTQILGDTNPIELRDLKSKYSAFKLNLNPNEDITIYTKIIHTGAIDIAWLTLSVEFFENFIIKESTIIGILIGILIAIIFYNFILYIRLNDKLYLFYLFHITAAFLFQISTTNLLYEFGVILNGVFSWIVASFGIGSLILFAKYFFNTKVTAVKLNIFLNFMIALTFILSIYFTFASFYPSLMEYRKIILLPTITMTTLLMIALAIFALYKKLPGALYYTFGQIGYLICFMIPLFNNLAHGELSLVIAYIATFGVLLDVIFLTLALSKKIKDMKEQKEHQEKQLFSQARFASIGKSIATVSHQWKTPLAHISISLVNFEAYLYKNDTQDQFLQDFAKNMRESVSFMSQTIDEINNFYLLSHTQKESFVFIDLLNFIKKLLEKKISLSQAKIVCDIDQNMLIRSHKNILGNILMILMDNALDMFIARKTESPFIKISVETQKENLIVKLEDNAGGINIEPIERIFDDFVSSKTSSGLGLSIAKSLVENRLNGTIDVQNSLDGSLFTISYFEQ